MIGEMLGVRAVVRILYEFFEEVKALRMGCDGPTFQWKFDFAQGVFGGLGIGSAWGSNAIGPGAEVGRAGVDDEEAHECMEEHVFLWPVA